MTLDVVGGYQDFALLKKLPPEISSRFLLNQIVYRNLASLQINVVSQLLVF